MKDYMDAVSFSEAVALMKEQFGRDYQFALATCRDNAPSLRFVDTYFDGEAFYVATHALSQKMVDISVNPAVALCARKMHSFTGTAENIGHPLKPENAAIREKLIEVFSPGYFTHNDENDEKMCYLKITPTTGFFHKNGMAYRINFADRTAAAFSFEPDVAFIDE